MMEEEIVITPRDARRFLTREEYMEIEDLRTAIELGYPLPPEAWRRYDVLCHKVRWKKRKDLAESLAYIYQDELKEDESKLKKMAVKEARIQNRHEAIQYFIKQFPQFQRLFERVDPVLWVTGDLGQVKEVVEKLVGDTFHVLTEEAEHPEAFYHRMWSWLILVPCGYYAKHGIDTLELNFAVYAIATLKVYRGKHKKFFKGWSFSYPPSGRPVAEFTLLFKPEDLSGSSPVKLIVPLKLLYGLASNSLQPDGCEIIRQQASLLVYRVEGFEPEVVLTLDFVNFLTGLKGDPQEKLHELGLISKMTLQILEAKRRRPLKVPEVRRKDMEYLRRIHGTEGYVTYSGWGEVLGITREGAYRALKRLDREGLLVMDKHESGEGIRVMLTEKGLAVIPELPDFNSKNQH